jgi:hypothetical protein
MKMYYVESRMTKTPYKQLKSRNYSWVSHILHRDCLLRHILEGMLEARSTELLDDLKENTFAKKIASENITSK